MTDNGNDERPGSPDNTLQIPSRRTIITRGILAVLAGPIVMMLGVFVYQGLFVMLPMYVRDPEGFHMIIELQNSPAELRAAYESGKIPKLGTVALAATVSLAQMYPSRVTLVAAFSLLVTTGCSWPSTADDATRPSVLRLAVTTSTRDSGLLDVLVPVFERRRPIRVDVIAVGTGAALKLGEAGDVDVILVHARAAENEFMASGYGARREDIMYNMFAILGPPDDPAGIRNREPAQTLQTIAKSGQPFVSRGDESGTHKRERKLWEDGGGRPPWEGYVESGQGMGATLIMADQMNAYVLSDRGTHSKFKHKIRLVPLVVSSRSLRNPYGIIVVNPENHSNVNCELAQEFVDFMISPEAQLLIRNYQLEGEPLFYPSRLPTTEQL